VAPVRRILSVVGTRPNFMKIAPVVRALEASRTPFEHHLVHTGQHYDDGMSRVFFDELGIPRPAHQLDVGSGSHAAQTARVMERIEPVMEAVAPDLVLVPGDVNSTMAATLVAVKLGIPVGHVEAGLRSFDRTMPEETNRVVTDAVSSLLFIHSPEARDHLLREGRPEAAIHDVGNTMIDTLVAMGPAIERAGAPARHGLADGDYLVVTLHRPALTDGPLLGDVVRRLETIARDLPVVFPVHPRTRARLDGGVSSGALRLVEPLGYVEFLSLVARAAGVLTDSGGIQEETTYLGVPCFTLRDNTERPVTVSLGTNTLLGLRPERVAEVPALLEAARARAARVPPGWDGRAAERLVAVLEAAAREAGARRHASASSAPSRSSSIVTPSDGVRHDSRALRPVTFMRLPSWSATGRASASASSVAKRVRAAPAASKPAVHTGVIVRADRHAQPSGSGSTWPLTGAIGVLSSSGRTYRRRASPGIRRPKPSPSASRASSGPKLKRWTKSCGWSRGSMSVSSTSSQAPGS
jgi:UDP-N-acetylglucosamine 2-epimerase (non-hydrolysing)